MTFIFRALVFYTTLIVILGLVGVGISQDAVLFPEKPTIPIIGNIPLLGFIVEGSAFLILIIGAVINIFFTTFTDVLPIWLNIIIFLPIVIFGVYELTARLIRGS